MISTSQLIDDDDIDYITNILYPGASQNADEESEHGFIMVFFALLPILLAIVFQATSVVLVAFGIGLALIAYCVILKRASRNLLHVLKNFAEDQKISDSRIKQLIRELKEREIMLRGYLMLRAHVSSFDNATLREVTAVSNLTDGRKLLHLSLAKQFLALREITASLFKKREKLMKSRNDEDLLKNCFSLVRMSLSDFQALQEDANSITIGTVMTCQQYACLQRAELLRLILVIFCFNVKKEDFPWTLMHFLSACENCIIDLQKQSIKIRETVDCLIRLNSAEVLIERDSRSVAAELDIPFDEKNYRSLSLHTQLALERLTSFENENFDELLKFVEFHLKAAMICIEQIRDSRTQDKILPQVCSPHPLKREQTHVDMKPAIFDESHTSQIKDEVFEAFITQSAQATEKIVKDTDADIRLKIDAHSKSTLLTELKSVLTVRHDLMLKREWNVVSMKQDISFDEFKRQYLSLNKIGTHKVDDESMNDDVQDEKTRSSKVLPLPRLACGSFRDELSDVLSRLTHLKNETDFVVGDDDD